MIWRLTPGALTTWTRPVQSMVTVGASMSATEKPLKQGTTGLSPISRAPVAVMRKTLAARCDRYRYKFASGPKSPTN